MALHHRLARLEQRYGQQDREPTIIFLSFFRPNPDGPPIKTLTRAFCNINGRPACFTKAEGETEEAFEDRVRQAKRDGV